MKVRTLILIYIPVLVLILSGCRKNPEDVPKDKNFLMMIHFTHDFINPKLKAIVFISDKSGNTVADTMISGNTDILMQTRVTYTPPLLVTIVTWEPDMHNFAVTLNTYTCVSPSEWTLKGHRLTSAGDATINLVNVPTHTGPILYSNRGYSNLTFATTGRSHPVYLQPDDLYIGLTSVSIKMFRWASGIYPGNTYDIDLASMMPVTPHRIHLPSLVVDFHAKIQAYTDTLDPESLPFTIDEQLGSGSSTSDIQTGFPAGIFTGYLTTVETIASWTDLSSYQFRQFGRLPDSLAGNTTSVTSVQHTGSSVSFSTVGDYTVSETVWTFQDQENLAFTWTIFCPDSTTSVTLPTLPPLMTGMFPTLKPDSMKFDQIRLNQFPSIPSYAAWLHTRTSADGHLRLERAELRSFVKRIN